MQNGQKHGVYTRIMKQKCIMQTQFDFQVGDSSSTLGAFRLWFDFQNRFNFGSGMQTGAPCPQHLPARRICSPGQPPDGQMCLLGAYFAKSLFSEHKIDVVTRIKFWKQPKSTKVHKKAPPGMPEALEFIRLSKPIRLSSDFARRGKSTCNARWVVWRGVTCLHRALAALGRPARYSFGCFALRAPHHRGFARRPLLWAVL